jgi:hypothetical protein
MSVSGHKTVMPVLSPQVRYEEVNGPSYAPPCSSADGGYPSADEGDQRVEAPTAVKNFVKCEVDDTRSWARRPCWTELMRGPYRIKTRDLQREARLLRPECPTCGERP